MSLSDDHTLPGAAREAVEAARAAIGRSAPAGTWTAVAITAIGHRAVGHGPVGRITFPPKAGEGLPLPRLRFHLFVFVYMLTP